MVLLGERREFRFVLNIRAVWHYILTNGTVAADRSSERSCYLWWKTVVD